ncbi:dimethylarginine dimethylaminohydrolase family protein [Phytoactinopolyspora limicola]|uniref:dimethylarginine dimethylaminohydrolase family protein n=1 Tax=Phytoactinopolyspora limicola TaxID=2715536 RepID=UPI00140D11EB|nr:arginine deiminase family protein [Phytoactinopolyspora limicola]
MIQISNPSDVAPLTDVIVGPSKRFGWWDLIWGSLRYPDLASLRYASNNRVRVPKHDLAQRQHSAFVKVLRDAGATARTLEDLSDVSIQLYPRDLAFAVDDVLFLARSRDPIRRKEQRALDPLLPKMSRVERLDGGLIEGGDVIVTNSDVLVGLSEATNLAGVTALREAFARTGITREVVPIEFSGRGVVHLDTKFTMVGPQLGFVHSAALTPCARRQLADRFELIEATGDEARSLMVNTVALAPDRIVIDQRAHRLADVLRGNGIEPVALDFSEVTKFPGGFRCATLPLSRSRS